MDSVRSLKIIFQGVPMPKQSARFGKYGVYQTKDVKDKERSMKLELMSQISRKLKPFDGALGVDVLFVFPIPKSFGKKND